MRLLPNILPMAWGGSPGWSFLCLEAKKHGTKCRKFTETKVRCHSSGRKNGSLFHPTRIWPPRLRVIPPKPCSLIYISRSARGCESPHLAAAHFFGAEYGPPYLREEHVPGHSRLLYRRRAC